jgi:hypothetical protein
MKLVKEQFSQMIKEQINLADWLAS